MATSLNLFELREKLRSLPVGEQFLLFKNLQTDMRTQEAVVLQLFRDANDISRLKNLVVIKKECAVEELLMYLPFLKSECHEIKIIYLRILPVLFSYVSLYDMKVTETQHIIEMIQIHPAFASDQYLFGQWFALFNRRKETKKRFSFKDEACTRGLPEIEIQLHSEFAHCVGYKNIPLLRAFHRWLRLHRLHKYLFFFANLSYEEVLGINDSNISYYEEKINLQNITLGARNKILREVDALRARKKSLEGIIQTSYRSYQSVETAVREIKRILRTPICVDDNLGENLPGLLMNALEKVFHIVHEQVGTSETIIPIYGLLISVLKEAWNYSIFRREQKNFFNEWRLQLTNKINQNNKMKLGFTSPRSVNISVDNLNFSGLSLADNSTGNAYYQCLEDVAKGCVNYIFQ